MAENIWLTLGGNKAKPRQTCKRPDAARRAGPWSTWRSRRGMAGPARRFRQRGVNRADPWRLPAADRDRTVGCARLLGGLDVDEGLRVLRLAVRCRPGLRRVAAQLGETLGAAGVAVIYGGGHVGLMGPSPMRPWRRRRGDRPHPDPLLEREIGHRAITELITTPTCSSASDRSSTAPMPSSFCRRSRDAGRAARRRHPAPARLPRQADRPRQPRRLLGTVHRLVDEIVRHSCATRRAHPVPRGRHRRAGAAGPRHRATAERTAARSPGRLTSVRGTVADHRLGYGSPSAGAAPGPAAGAAVEGRESIGSTSSGGKPPSRVASATTRRRTETAGADTRSTRAAARFLAEC